MTELLPSRGAILLDLRKALLITPVLGLLVVVLAGDVGFGLAVTAFLAVFHAAAAAVVWWRTPRSLTIQPKALVVRRRGGDERTWPRKDVGLVWLEPDVRAPVGGDLLRATKPDPATDDPALVPMLAPWAGERVASVSWFDREALLEALTANGWAMGTPMELGRRPITRRRPTGFS